MKFSGAPLLYLTVVFPTVVVAASDNGSDENNRELMSMFVDAHCWLESSRCVHIYIHTYYENPRRLTLISLVTLRRQEER